METVLETMPEPTLVARLTTHVIFLLDESGSMRDAASDVLGGYNAYINQLKQDGNHYTCSLFLFGSVVRPRYVGSSLEEVPLLTEEDYRPLYSTALYDAIGYAFLAAQEHWGTVHDRFLMVIMTDGLENASRHFQKAEIVEEIKKREYAGNWTFVYLGADQDAWSVASGLGFAEGNVASYASDSTRSTFSTLRTATSTASYPTTSFFGETS